MKRQRYITNSYPDYVSGLVTYNEKDLRGKVEEQLSLAIGELHDKCPPTAQSTLESNGSKDIDLTMYTGSFGNVYVQWRLYELYKSRKDSDRMATHLSSALEAFLVNRKLVEKYGQPSQAEEKESPSFFMGKAGLYTLGAMLYKEAGKAADMISCYKRVIAALPLCKTSYSQDELLYGNAGYLYCLLLLHKRDPAVFNCKAQIAEVAGLLKTSGEKKGHGKLLAYSFPREKGTFYYGAAHGTFGILYLLMKAAEATGVGKDPALMDLLRRTCEYMVTLQFGTGNFPMSFGGKKDNMVQFCHGAPGAIPALLEAHKLFKSESFLSAALKAGETVWTRGILLKGNGLCHGITGNAYMLHSIYAYTADVRWKYRAHMFADASWNEIIQTVVKKHKDPGRISVGISDTPYSLMEGLGGTVVFYADLLHDTPEMLFPGYEL